MAMTARRRKRMQQLSVLRRRAGFPRRSDVADFLGLHPQTIYQRESGRTRSPAEYELWLGERARRLEAEQA